MRVAVLVGVNGNRDVAVAVAVGVGVGGSGVFVAVGGAGRVGVAVSVGGRGVFVAVAVGVRLGVAVEVAVRVGLEVGRRVAVALGTGVGETPGFGVLEEVEVGVGVGDGVAVLVAPAVGVPVGAIAVAVGAGGVGEADTTGVAGGTGVGVADASGVIDAAGLGMLAGAVGGSLKQPVPRSSAPKTRTTSGRPASASTLMVLPAVRLPVRSTFRSENQAIQTIRRRPPRLVRKKITRVGRAISPLEQRIGNGDIAKRENAGARHLCRLASQGVLLGRAGVVEQPQRAASLERSQSPDAGGVRADRPLREIEVARATGKGDAAEAEEARGGDADRRGHRRDGSGDAVHDRDDGQKFRNRIVE